MKEKFKQLEFANKDFQEICRIMIECTEFESRNQEIRVKQNIRNLAETLYREDRAAANYLINPNARPTGVVRQKEDCQGCGKELTLKGVKKMLDDQGIVYDKRIKSVEKLAKLLK